MTFIPVTDITLSIELNQLVVGQETSFTATVVPANATNKHIVWSRVSGVNVTIDQSNDGQNVTLTALASGSAKIRGTIVNGRQQ